MLATIAFFSTGILIIAFALILKGLVKKAKISTDYYAAYFLLGLAFIGYGVATALDDQNLLKTSMIIGNFLMFTGTALLLLTKSKLSRNNIMLGSFVAAVILTALRVVLFPPAPVLSDGVLHFKTQLAVGIPIALMFLLIWLPRSLSLAKSIASAFKFNELYSIYAGLFSLTTMSAILFLAAKNNTSLIITFTTITASFLALVVISLLTSRMKKS